MHIGVGEHTYEWIEHWARIPDSPTGRTNGRTHGIAVTDAGHVVVFHQANPALLVFDADGKLLNAWGDRFEGAHGLTLTHAPGNTPGSALAEHLWLTDQRSGEVVKTTLAGETLQSLDRPDLPVYNRDGGKYSPTSVAVHEERHGGHGDIWVADGYGASLVHRYNKAGQYLSTISGAEGDAGPFKCPHGIAFDTRRGEPELYIADRGNCRVQVYDAEGRFKRAFGSDMLTSPCGFATHGEHLLIPELFARLAVLDADDQLVGYLGANEATRQVEGWPNHPPERIHPGRFNSPHGMAADAAGNLYIAEWIIGGRITKLARS